MLTTDFEAGLLTGLLVGEGHFGGDGRQPQITLRMHTRHEALFQWLVRTFPGGKLYGPYSHDGRSYYQWMVRGLYLRNEILPLLERTIDPSLDAHTHARLQQMKVRYASRLGGSSPQTEVEPSASTRPSLEDPSGESFAGDRRPTSESSQTPSHAADASLGIGYVTDLTTQVVDPA